MALSKRNKIIIIAAAAAVCIAAIVIVLVLCLPKKSSAPTYAFTETEYTLSSGGRVTADGAEKYVIVGTAPDGVTLSEDGVFTLSGGVADGTQVIVGAVSGGKIRSTAVVTFTVSGEAPVIAFSNLSVYLTDGERVRATATPVYAITYSIKTEVDGISIDSSSGAVRFSSKVTDGTAFTVTASAKGVTAEKNFMASVGLHVFALNPVVITENGVGGACRVTLDFTDDTEAEAAGAVGVSLLNENLEKDRQWSYDPATKTVDVDNSVLERLKLGENELTIYTARNSVAVTVKSAKYINTAEDLAAIKAVGDDRSALTSYYVMTADIDLTDYLADSEDGWMPIGIYHDVADGTAEVDAFNGTFDGNGHTVSGYWAARTDEFAFNAGLFGYVGASAQIMNLNLVGSTTKATSVRSFSGTLVGANNGIVTNCSSNVSLSVDADIATVGGFVGRNQGTISCCYSLGALGAGTNHGSFVGDNRGEITNCYAVSASGLAFCGVNSGNAYGATCRTYTTVDGLKGADFDAWTDWVKEEGQLPVLPIIEIQQRTGGDN